MIDSYSNMYLHTYIYIYLKNINVYIYTKTHIQSQKYPDNWEGFQLCVSAERLCRGSKGWNPEKGPWKSQPHGPRFHHFEISRPSPWKTQVFIPRKIWKLEDEIFGFKLVPENRCHVSYQKKGGTVALVAPRFVEVLQGLHQKVVATDGGHCHLAL